MDKRFLAILGGLIVVFVAFFAISSSNNNKNATPSKAGLATNHQVGIGKDNVTLIEYGDYQCPVCQIYYPPLKQVAAQFSQQIYFQFRNLPLSQIHPNAYAAARAAEAADLQGKFWQMHDALYDNQSEWTPVSNPMTKFEAYAKNIGLNLTQFKSDYLSSKVNDAINADLDAFDKTGQEKATPAFFLNGKFIENSELVDAKTGQPSVEKFSELINKELAAKAKR